MSSQVLTDVVKVNRNSILSFWAKVGYGERSGMGDAVESLFWNDLSKSKENCIMQAFRLTESNANAEQDNLRLVGNPVCKEGILLENVGTVTSDKSVIHMDKNCALIDFAGPGRRVHQTTVSDDHSMSLDGMITLLLSFGYLEKLAGGEPSDKKLAIAKRPPAEKLGFYWVVPYGVKNKWKDRAPKRYSRIGKRKNETAEEKNRREKNNVMRDVVNECLKTHVQQYVLVLEKDPPQPEGAPVDESVPGHGSY